MKSLWSIAMDNISTNPVSTNPVSTNSTDRAQALFRDSFGRNPQAVVLAPGRVNLIGDHTDYVGGWVMPAALTQVTAVAFERLAEARVEAVSANFAERVSFSLADLAADAPIAGWGGYLAGVAWALIEQGFSLGGLACAVVSDVPTGGGLSSSAALEVAMARAWREVNGFTLSDVDVAVTCRRAENAYVGVPSGIMDQFACGVPQPGEAIRLDCAKLEYQVIAVPDDWAFVVVDSGASRRLAGSAYATRVRECQQIAQHIFGTNDITRLRDLTEAQVASLEGVLKQRARHVLTENQRVKQAADALTHADISTFGSLMDASHASLRDDYAVSSEALDTLVTASRAFSGCYGSRLTGAGFGGCTVSLLERPAVAAFARYLQEKVPSSHLVTVL
jgi:galactokinase